VIGMSLPADAILVRGRVVVDESMLTGESVPVTKSAFQHSSTDKDATKRTANILYSGTVVKVVYEGSGGGGGGVEEEGVAAAAVAMAYRTGFRSARGELIAALITPKVHIHNLLYFLFVVFVFGCGTMIGCKKIETSSNILCLCSVSFCLSLTFPVL
jgi:magnesium-transporting ATPase (P-type)